MIRIQRRIGLTLVAVSLLTATACGMNYGGMKRQSRGASPQPMVESPSSPVSPEALSGSNISMLRADEAKIPIETVDGKKCVSGQKLADTVEFQKDWNPATGKLRIGDNDAVYELSGGSNQAVVEGKPLTLAEAPKVSGDTLQIPLSVVEELFRGVISHEVRDNELAIKPNPNAIDKSAMNLPTEPEGKQDEWSFADDPQHPKKRSARSSGPSSSFSKTVLEAALPIRDDSIPVQTSIDTDSLIASAKRYLGVKYEFGTGPYPQSGKFDCSTFTQYLYGKQGITLPRTAREQARMGETISRTMLRPGDLLFFYVPGRFKTDQTVGHVGIYMGNNQMIHASPKPEDGVQITNINQPYWKRTFLLAKRHTTP